MSNLMKKVRVVHSPLEKRFFVEIKSIFGLRWRLVDIYSYSDKDQNNLANEAFKKAIMRCETLMARSVVWQQTNYFRGK